MAFGLYTHIKANQRRSALLIISLFALIYMITFATEMLISTSTTQEDLNISLRNAAKETLNILPFVTLGLLIWIFIAWKYNRSIISLTLPNHTLEKDEVSQIHKILENLCISRGMPLPKLTIIDVDAPNAFASGINESQYTITLTRGLVDMLDQAEIEAVIADELTHIRNGDVQLMMIAMIMTGVISFFCEILFRIVSSGPAPFGSRPDSSSSSNASNDKKSGALVAIALLIVASAWILSLIIRPMLSRSREYLADAGSVELTKNPDAMISALKKIDGNGEIEGATSGVMEMCLDNPRSGIANLFSSHPSIESRIDAIKNFAGGFDASEKF